MSQADAEMLRAEVDRLLAWVADLQSGGYVNCVYCGHRYGPRDTTPETMADVLKIHIAQCPRHPMAELLHMCRAADDALSSLLAVREGMTDQAITDVRDAIRGAIERATKVG